MGTTANIQLGIGDLALKTYVAGTYTGFTNVGFHSEKGGSFKYKGELLKVKSGNHLATTKIFVVGEEASLEAAVQEFTALNVARALGLADADVSDDAVNHIKSLYVGGNTTNNYFSAQFRVDFDVAGLYGELIIFKGRFAGEMTLEMAPNKVIEVPTVIECLADDAAGDTNGKLAQLNFKYQV
ncbi:MAG: hypothetical protein AB1824_01245 [Acidobacteriota bacterium]